MQIIFICVFMKALVLINKKKQIAKKLKSQVERFLLEKGIELSNKKPDFVVSIGGDGTVLFAKKYYGIPFFSIGSNTSFICQANFSDWKKKLEKALLQKKLEERILLEAKLDKKVLPLALNEIGIRNPYPRLLSIYLKIDRDYVFRADGVLFCTPTGSPAYCYSCAGKQMKKNERKYQVVAISPFRRLFKPKIVNQGQKSILLISGKEKAQLFVDGQVVGYFSKEQELEVYVSKKKFLFFKV